MFLKRKNFKMYFEYETKSDYIAFFGSGFEKDKDISILINTFLLSLSKKQNIYFEASYLPYEDAIRIIEPSIIVEKAESLLNPPWIFFNLKEARVKVDLLERACEATIYFFENNVGWSDFLSSSVISKKKELVKNGLLQAHFTMLDHGTQCWFEGSSLYEKEVLQLLRKLSDLGCKVEPMKKRWLSIGR